jgi:hypothetical protein
MRGHLEKLPYCKRTKAESAALPQLFSIRFELIEVPEGNLTVPVAT